jgi:hypothetical protein
MTKKALHPAFTILDIYIPFIILTNSSTNKMGLVAFKKLITNLIYSDPSFLPYQ